MKSSLQYLLEIKQAILKRWWLIALASIVVFIFGYLYKKSFKPEYQTYARIFPLAINSSGSGSPLDALKAQFGVSEKSDLDKIYNITELVNSKNVSFSVVSKAIKHKKYKTLSDWLIDDFNSHLPMFGKKLTNNPKDSFMHHVIGRNLLLAKTKVDFEKTEFYTLSTTAYTEDLAKLMNELILEQLSLLYVKVTTEKPRTDMNLIRQMRDSLHTELNAIERAIAGFRDANQLSSKYLDNIPQAKLERTRLEIQELYTTTVSAYQNAKFKLLSESPIFQILDKPGEPYNEIRQSPMKFGAITSLATAMLLSFLFSLGVIWQMIKQEFFS